MRPPVPVSYSDEDLQGNKRDWLRLIHVDLRRAYKQDSKYSEHREDTGYQTLADYEALRDYLNKHLASHHEVYYDAESNQLWVEVTTPTSPFYRTSRAQWNTILTRWPSFIDEEARGLLTR